MVVAASSSNFKKRKIAPTPAAVPSNGTTGTAAAFSSNAPSTIMKKKSPLYNQPQNHYAPPTITTMTKDQLSAWRKEQRRKRNRESAAASRTKTRARIEELEGEVEVWKVRCGEMKGRMAGMERHLIFLTGEIQKRQLLQSQQQGQGRQVTANRVVSQPNSPPRGMSPALAPEHDNPAESNVPFLPPLVAGSAQAASQMIHRQQRQQQPTVIVPQLALSNPNINTACPLSSSLPISHPKDCVLKNKQHKTLSDAQEKKWLVSPSSNNNNKNNNNNNKRLEEDSIKKMQHIIPISRQA